MEDRVFSEREIDILIKGGHLDDLVHTEGWKIYSEFLINKVNSLTDQILNPFISGIDTYEKYIATVTVRRNLEDLLNMVENKIKAKNKIIRNGGEEVNNG